MNHCITIGIAPGYTDTYVWLSRDSQILQCTSLPNIKIFPQLWNIIDTLCEQNHIDRNSITRIVFLNGPAPLTTCRTICAWIQGWMRAQPSLQTSLLGGMGYWLQAVHHNNNPAVFITQAYGGNVYWYDNQEQKELKIRNEEAIEHILNLPATTFVYKSKNILPTLPQQPNSYEEINFDPSALKFNLGQAISDPALVQPYVISMHQRSN